MAYIFQYGSNTSIDRLNSPNRLNGSANFISVVKSIKKFDFDFTVWSNRNKCAAANIIEDGDRQIIGVLYEIPDDKVFRSKCASGSRCLDQIEGEGSNYRRIKIDLEDMEGKPIPYETLTYIVNEGLRKSGIKTSSKYVSHIVTGLESVKVPVDYIEYIINKAKENNPEITLPNNL